MENQITIQMVEKKTGLVMSSSIKHKFYYEGSLSWCVESDPIKATPRKNPSDKYRYLSINEANKLNVLSFFNLKTEFRRFSGNENGYLISLAFPNTDLNNAIPIPFEIAEHENRIVADKSIQEIIEIHVERHFSGKKFLFSTNPRDCLCLEFNKFSYEDYLYVFEGTHLTTPFCLFDETVENCIYFDFDLSLTVFLRKKELPNIELGGLPKSFWFNLFEQNFTDAVIKGNQSHLDYVNKNIVPLFPKLKPISF